MLPVEVRFHSKYRIDNNGCWLWTDAPEKDGYGRLQVNDRAAKGRSAVNRNPAPGEANGRAVFTESEVIDLRLHQALGGRINKTAEARKRGMNRCTVERMLTGEAWAHLPLDLGSLQILAARP